MAFRIRRGTNTDRLSITPDEGELLYTTDTENVYIGDGSTVGGNLLTTSLINDTSPELSANLDLGGNDIVGTGNINIDGTITATGNINLGDGAEDNVIVGGVISSSLIPSDDRTYDLGTTSFAWRNGFFEGISVDGEISTNSLSVSNIYAEGSSLLFDSLTNTISGNLLGDVTGNLTGDVTGNLIGDVQGSVFGDDSTTIVDSINNEISAINVNTSSIVTDSDTIEVSSIQNIETQLQVRSQENRSVLKLSHESIQDISGFSNNYGAIFFERDDINGPLTTGIIAGNGESIVLTADPTGQFSSNSNFVVFRNDKLGIGTQDPQNTLDVRGEIISSSYIQFGSFTTTERNSLSAQNGIVIYNTTDNRFQGYQNGSWINLDDGSGA